MKCSLGISNFLEEISSLFHSVVFLYFFALTAEEGFLISSCYSLELCIQMLISFLFASLLFTAICKASSDSHFAFLHFFSMGMVLIPVSCTVSQTSVHSSLGTLSIRSSPLNLFLTSTVSLGWKKHKLESRLPREIPITSDMQMIPPLWHKVKRN